MKDNRTVKVINRSGPMGFTLFLGFVGSLVYFVNITHGFWGVVLAFLKAIVWPAFFVYYGLDALGVK
jgi:hypothetical protein